MDFPHDTFTPRPGATIAYRRTQGRAPGVMFCGGFRSDMTGGKATYLEEQCAARGQAYVRFDYTGHGFSGGRFEDGCIGDWLQDALDVLDAHTQGPQVVVGSSMGGWIALLLALRRTARVAGLVLLAPAPDFSERMFEKELTDAQRRELLQDGITYLPSAYGDPYPVTKRLYEEAKNHLLLHSAIDIRCPVRIIHSKLDDAVPWRTSEKIREKIAAQDITVTYLEDGDHRLSRGQDLRMIGKAVEELSGPRP